MYQARLRLTPFTLESQMSHTPGPWEWVSFSGNPHSILEPGVLIPYGDDDTDQIGVSEEDARLIAAAPCLLAACKAVRLHCPCDPDINPQWYAAWMSMLDAIAKAQGPLTPPQS